VPAARFRVQDLDLSDRAVAFGQLLAAYGDDAAPDDRGLQAAARNMDGPQPLPAARIGVVALDPSRLIPPARPAITYSLPSTAAAPMCSRATRIAEPERQRSRAGS
jgi:hypothetical protein